MSPSLDRTVLYLRLADGRRFEIVVRLALSEDEIDLAEAVGAAQSRSEGERIRCLATTPNRILPRAWPAWPSSPEPFIAYQLGVLNAIGKPLVDHSINSTQREVERQKAENERSAAKKP